jgi:nucleoside-diphosphate kinase
MGTKSKYYERTLILLKPDAVQRGLMGEIVSRFERKGLKITAMKMVWATKEMAEKHYFWSEEEKLKTGNRTIQAHTEKGLKITKTPIEYAEDVQRRLSAFLVAGPIVAIVIEGAHAIEHVRKLVGHGSPLAADVGTIRADYTIDSYVMADEVDRVSRNLVHASSSVDEAERELKVWFDEKEICNYELAIEKILYSKEWEEPQI